MKAIIPKRCAIGTLTHGIVLGFSLRSSNGFSPRSIGTISCLSPSCSQNIFLNHGNHDDIFSRNPGMHNNMRTARSPQNVTPSLEARTTATLYAIPPQIQELGASVFSMNGPIPLIQALGINALLFGILQSKLFKVLTPEGYISAAILGTGLWHTLGWRGWIVAVAYLGFGSAVTKVKMKEKEEAGIAEKRGGRRGPENVWGSAATGLMCSFLSVPSLVSSIPFVGTLSTLFTPELWVLAYVSSLATKLADTFASEIGKAYGKTTFLITTLERVPPGTEGAISLEGTLASVMGGLLLSLIAYLPPIHIISSWQGVIISTTAAFLATLAESYLGAILQTDDDDASQQPKFAWATNEVVNFLNTLIGATLALTFGSFVL